jgi:hypothetical protein
MFNRIKQMVEDARAQAAHDQPRQQVVERFKLDDPVAARTEWVPAVEGGASFCTRKLVQVSSGRVEFRPTTAGRVIPLIFLVVGLAALAFVVYALSNDVGDSPFITIVPLAVGCLFAGGGGTLYWFMTRRIAFDQGTGCFWKGGSTPISVADIESRKDTAPLAQIHAVQLISEFIETARRSSRGSGSSSRYYSYEINLVLKDGSRINVVDHGDLARIQQDARQLGQFLDVPIWEVT